MKRLFKKEAGIKMAMMLIIASMVLIMIPAGTLYADTTGAHSPTVATGSFSWTNPNNILVSDDVYTVGTYLGIYGTGYGFNIPSDATINGVEVSIERKRTKQFSSSKGIVYDNMAALALNGAYVASTNKAVIWTQWSLNTEETKVFGSPTDTWGLALTPADVNNSGFGFYLHPLFQNTGGIAHVDHIGITVYYTLPAPVDSTPPVIDPIADITLDATSASGAVVTFSPTATDNVDPSVTVNAAPASGSTFPVGTTQVTLNASDVAGNNAIAVNFNVIVNAFTPPSGGGGSTPPPSGGGGAPAASGISVLGIANFSNGGSITDFVTRMYRTILLREPDAEGLAGWVEGITNGGLEGSDVARGFVFSEEYNEYMASLDDNGYLNFLYNRFFGRPADIEGLNGWMVNLSEGMSRVRVLNYFLDCEEWNTICDSYGVTP